MFAQWDIILAKRLNKDKHELSMMSFRSSWFLLFLLRHNCLFFVLQITKPAKC